MILLEPAGLDSQNVIR